VVVGATFKVALKPTTKTKYKLRIKTNKMMINAPKSRRDDPLLTVDAIYGRKTARIAAKSRRDDPLLTVGFNLRWLHDIN